MASTTVVQNLHDVLARDVLLGLGADLGVVRFQTLQQHLLVRGHAGSGEHRGTVGNPGQEHEALANGRAGARLVERHHLEDAVQHLVVVQMLQHLRQTVAAVAKHLQRLVLRQLAQDPVHRRVLLLELLPQRVERHLARLHVRLVVALEFDVLGSDIEDILIGSVAAGGAVQLLDDLLLRHLLQRVDLKTDVRSSEELTHARRDRAHLRTVDNRSLRADPSNEHELGATTGNSRLVLNSNHLNQGELALHVTPTTRSNLLRVEVLDALIVATLSGRVHNQSVETLNVTNDPIQSSELSKQTS